MLKNLIPGNILFLDIETVPLTATYEQCPEPLKTLWAKKSLQIAREEADTPESLWPRAGIYAEFGKIICISVAYFTQNLLRIKSFHGHDERLILSEFSRLLNGYFNKEHHRLCAHNGKEFDFPYIARRLLINKMSLPDMLDVAGAKPWQVQHLDTMELWKFGDYKHYTSLELLAAVFGIPSPKQDICGADVCRVYWEEGDPDRIARYCCQDVTVLAQILLSYLGRPAVAANQMQFA